jgi:hypothetical protein
MLEWSQSTCDEISRPRRGLPALLLLGLVAATWPTSGNFSEYAHGCILRATNLAKTPMISSFRPYPMGSPMKSAEHSETQRIEADMLE